MTRNRAVLGDSPMNMELALFTSDLRIRYELLSSLDDYIKQVSGRETNPRDLIDRFELQGDNLLMRLAQLDVQGAIRWLATDSVLRILERGRFDQFTILRDESATPLQI